MAKSIYDPKNDPRFARPVVDRDEWQKRDLADGETIPFRFLHGFFEGTKVKFSFFFPLKEKYQGRFHQYLSPFPGPDEEMASIGRTGVNDRIGFALHCGAYFIETNMGSVSQFSGPEDPTLTWKASAAAAEFSRKKAMEMYETDKRPFGYVYGGSGGGYKAMACIENTRAWDGAVLYVIGSPVSLPNTITMHVQGQRVLRNAFGKILDALDAGGSGNPYDQLNNHETAMFRELTRMGFPPLAWYPEAWGMMDAGSLPVLLPGVKQMDPTYFTDFWTKPGYAGADPTSDASEDRIVFRTKVRSVHLPNQREHHAAIDGLNGVDDAWKKALASGGGAYLELEALPQKEDLYTEGLSMCFESGKAKDAVLLADQMMNSPKGVGGIVTIGAAFGMSDITETLSKVQPGDEILLDNSDYIAVQSYYRHQVPADPSFHAWDQFRDEDGRPVTPQRRPFPIPFTGVGVQQDGDIQGRVINIQALMDESTCPWCADWWRHKIIEAKGSDADHRTYFMERCMHGDTDARYNHMVVNYMGALRQALIDLAAWVEEGKEPLPRTAYTLGADGQIHPEENVKKRFGIQAIPTLKVNGGKLAQVKAGECVRFTVEVEVPIGAGEVTEILLCPEGQRDVPANQPFGVPLAFEENERHGVHTACAEHVTCYDEPGTYFAAVRIATQRQGNASDPFTQVLNLDRARVMVE